MNAHEHVFPAVDPPGVDRVEDLAEHEGVEDESVELSVPLLDLHVGVGGLVVSENDVAGEVEQEDDEGLVHRLTDDLHAHGRVEQRRGLAVGLAIEDLAAGGIGSEGESGEGVHDDVDPEQLHGGKDGFFGGRGDGGDEGDDDGGDVDGDLELQELADGIVDSAAPDDGGNDRSEVVIHKNDVRSLFGDLSSGDTHGESDVGGLESGAVVGTVTGDTDDFAKGLELLDQNLLILGRRTSQNLQTRYDFRALSVRQVAESGSFHDDTSGSEYTALVGNRPSRKNVVTRAHPDGDTSPLAIRDGLLDTFTERILDGGDGDEGQILEQIVKRNFLRVVQVRALRRPLLEITVRDGDGSEGLVGVEDDGAGQVLALDGTDGPDGDVVGRRGSGAGRVDDDVAETLVADDFGSTFEVDAELVSVLDDDTHGLAFAREGDHLDDGRLLAALAVVDPTLLLGKVKQSDFGLGANELELLGLGVLVLESRGVDGDRVVEHTAGGIVHASIDLVEVHGKVLRVTLVALGLALDVAHVAALVVLVLSEFAVDTDRASDDGHDVGRKRTGLVGANHGRVGHDFARAENTDEQHLLGHALGREREGERDGERKTFGNGDDDDGDSDNEDVDELHGLGVGGAVRIGLEVDEELDHESTEEDETSEGTQFGDQLGQSVKLDLERSVFGLATKIYEGSKISATSDQIRRNGGCSYPSKSCR